MKITFFSNIIGMKWVKQPHRYHVQRNTCANGNKGSLIIYLNNVHMYCFTEDSIQIEDVVKSYKRCRTVIFLITQGVMSLSSA